MPGLLIAVLGAVALLVAEFLPLAQVRSSERGTGVIAALHVGSHDSYALIPIAVIALVFVGVVARARTAVAWPPLAALVALGLIALGIALLGDLPDARATGLITTGTGNYASAQASPAVGFLIELLGAFGLVVGGGIGLLGQSRWRGPGG